MGTDAPIPSVGPSDVEQLHSMGYAQELRRGMKTFSNFAVSFTIISILSGCLTLFAFAMNTGGPVVMTLGWLFVGIFVILVALGMAEVASSYPTAGGLYYWAAKLADEAGGNGAAWSWFVGWFNLVGQVAVTAGIDFGLAFFINAFLNLEWGFPVDPPHTIFIYAVVLFVHGLLNTFGIRLVSILNQVSVWWHLVGVAAIVLVTVVLNQHSRTDLGTVFSTAVDNTGDGAGLSWPGPVLLGIPLYVALIGLLNAQYTLTGYDASAHMAEETHSAARSAPRGIIWSVIISVIAGFVLLVAMNVGISPDKVYTDSTGAAIAGYQHALNAAATLGIAGPPVQIWIDAVGQTGGLLILLLVIGAQFYCGMSSVTANSRMIYAFSRDGAIPASRFWHRINKRTRTPTNSIWLAAVAAFILGLPYLYSPVAYAAVTSIAVIGLYVAYVAPVFLRLRAGKRFKEGPWSLGRWSKPVGILATLWVVVIFVLFNLPQVQPFNSLANFNYTPVVFLVVLGGAAIWYAVSAKNWFKGPKVQGSPEELAAIEHELEAI